MNNVKDYKFNHSIYILFEVIDSLQASYEGLFPSDVETKINELKKVLIKHLEPKDYDFINRDFKFVEYFKRVHFVEVPKKLH